MVQLQEIVDEHFEESQPGPEEDDADYTDTGTSHPHAAHCLVPGVESPGGFLCTAL